VPTPAGNTGYEIAAAAIYPLEAWLSAMPHGAIVSGPVLEHAAAGLAGRPDLVVAPRECWQPSAVEAGRLALLRAAAGGADDPFTLVPEYLRPSYADERRAGTLGP
jgi:hypothetical protein